MARVTRPPHGDNFRVTQAGYIDGIFVIDGVRKFKGLCRLAAIERAPSGRRQTPKQLNDVVQRMWEEKREELEEGGGRRNGARSPIAAVMEDWRSHTEARGRSPLTLAEIDRMRRHYLAMVGDHAVGDSSTWHADRFLKGLQARRLSPASINSHLGRLATFWRYALDRELILALPKVARVKVPKQPRRVPTPEQVKALLERLERLIAAAGNGRERYYYELHRLLVHVLIGTGMRSGEALRIKREQIDLERRAIQLVTTKTNQPRICRIPRFLAEAITAHYRAHPFHSYLFGHFKKPGQPAWHGSAALTKAFTRHYEELGIKGQFKPLHGFRALYATAGLNNVGVDPLAMMSQIGHSDIKTTRDYYVASMQDAQLRAVDAIAEGFFAELLGRR